MSEKEKKSFKKKSKKILSFPSFRRAKKLNQIKEDVCLDFKDESTSDLSDKLTNDHGSSNSIPSLGLDATVSLDSPRKENATLVEKDDLGDAQGASTPNSERRSFSNLRSAYLDNPDFVRNAVSPGARRLGLGGSNNLSTDSGIDCSILLSEKGSPERFQEFTRREAERIRVEHLQLLNNSLPPQDRPENIENAIAEAGNQDVVSIGIGEASNTLEEQIEQTKEHINLLSELRTVLEQKLEACNSVGSADLDTLDNREKLPIDEVTNSDSRSDINIETMNSHNLADLSSNSRINEDHVVDSNAQNVRDDSSTESYNLLLHTNKTDERKSEEARMRLENASAFADSLVIDSPHLIVSPTPVVSVAATASHRILPATPSPVRLYVNEKSAFAKCKSLRRSVSDVGKGLLGKLRQKKKNVDDTKLEKNMNKVDGTSASEDSVGNIETDSDNHRDRLSDCSTFSAHLETSLLCENSESGSNYDIPSMSWEISDLNASIESSYEIDSINIEPNISHRQQTDMNYFDNSLKSNLDHSQGSISAIQELTTSICEMTSKLKLSPSQRSSANSIDCMCNCKNRADSPHCCGRSKPPSPFSMDNVSFNDAHIENIAETVDVNQDAGAGELEYDGNALTINNDMETVSADRNKIENIKLEHVESYIKSLNADHGNEIEVVPTETDLLLGINSITPLAANTEMELPVCQSKGFNREFQNGLSINTEVCDNIKIPCAEIENSWFNCDTEGGSDDSSCSSCSGCSDEDCSGRAREKRNLKVGTDSSSGDTSPTDFNTGSTCSDKSSDSESESSSLEGTPEKLKWQNASFDTNILDGSPYSVSYTELNVDGLEPIYLNKKTKFERCYNLPVCSPQSNFPSPEVNFLPARTSITPASSPMTNLNDQFNGSLVPASESFSQGQNVGGCRRKDAYVGLSPEHFESQSLLSLSKTSSIDNRAETSFSRNSKNRRSESSLSVSYMNNTKAKRHMRSEADLNMSGLNLMNSKGNQNFETDLHVNVSGMNISREIRQPDLIEDVQNSPVAPLDLSIQRDPSRTSESLKKKSVFWMDKHVGQVFSPAKIVLHKNRDISETDLCRNILDSYISDADESSLEPVFESSFANSFNSSMNGSMSFNTSLNMSNTFNSSLNTSSIMEPGSNDEDSVLQYGTYVAPRRPKKETNVDDFSTTVVSSCYTAEAKTRKLQGGHSGSDLNASRETAVGAGFVRGPAQTRPVLSRSRTSHRGRPYNPVHYQSSRRRQPTEETVTEIHERMMLACNEEKMRVKGRQETSVEMQEEPKGLERVQLKGRKGKDLVENIPEIIEDKGERVRVKGRREMRDEIQAGAEMQEDSGKVERERVKGRRETRDMVLKDRTNTGIQSAVEQQGDKGSEKSKSAPTNKIGGKENLKLLDLSETTFDQLTILHTARNGKRKVRCLSVYEAQSIVKHYPPPKEASSISWGQNLSEMDLSRHTPRKTPIKTKPILMPNKEAYPYEEDTPSPIVLTKLRRSKSLSKKFKNWPW